MLDSWPRVVEMFARTGLHAERAVFDANLLAVGALALDLWRDLVLEGARVTDATTTELRHSAVQLLGELDNEQAAREPPAVNHAPAGQPPAVNVVHRDEDWAVVREDAKRASGVFSTKREAVQRAKEIARREGAEVQIEPTGDVSR